MREKLVLRLPENEHAPVSWVILNEKGEPTGDLGRGNLDDAASHAVGRQVTILAPNSATMLTTTTVPNSKKSRIQQLLPFALEEQVTDDVDSLHFAPGDRRADGTLAVAVVSQEFMDYWRNRLRDAGIRAQEIVPEVLTLPYQDKQWTVLLDDENVLVRTGAEMGFAFDRSNLAAMLDIALAETEDEAKPEKLIVHDFGQDSLEVSELENLPDIGLEFEEAESQESALSIMASGCTIPSTINLLSGPYSPRQEMSKIWSPWQPAAILIAALILLQTGMAWADLVQLRAEEQAIRDEAQKVYQSVFPDTRRKIAIAQQKKAMETRLVSLKGGSGENADFIGILAEVSPTLSTTPGLELTQMEYRNGNLDIDIFLNNLQAVDQLKARLSQIEGISVDVKSATQKQNKIEGKLRIRGNS